MTINLLNPALPETKVSSVYQRSSRFIDCLFCQMRSRQVGDSPLCSNCLIDPVQTRTAIYLQMNQLEKAEARITADWLAFVAERADSWDRLRQAQARPDYAARCKAHRKAGDVYGQLLERHEAMELAVQPLAIEQARLEKALDVLRTL